MENQNQTMRNARKRDDEVEIDLLELLMALKRRIWAILLAAVLFGGVAGLYSKYVITPQYSSTAMLYILSKETTLTSLADLQIGSQLTQDYKIIVTSRPVLEGVIEQMSLPLTYEEMAGKISINNPTDTRILSITVQDPDPVMARDMVDTVAMAASDYIGDIMEMVPPKILEHGVIPQYKTSPSNARNAMMGAMLGIVLVCGIVVFEVLMNDSIQSVEDVEKYLGLTVLAEVPDRESGDRTPHYGYGTERVKRWFKKGREA
ncbi:MAG: Wzz/FepE/Etk N-terminal domain-containing protein [Clostridiales bacterium]|nr:Wzz/FepE/Etk N-terminal domain-containing protein [Clostridiales bacterium]